MSEKIILIHENALLRSPLFKLDLTDQRQDGFANTNRSSEKGHTFHAATALLQHPSIHVHLGLREELVPSQVCVVRGSDVVVAQGLVHVLVHFIVQWVKDVASRTSHEVREAFGRKSRVLEL